MSVKWTHVASNSLESWNPINSIKDPQEREKAQRKRSQKFLKWQLKLNHIKYDKPKKKDKTEEIPTD